MFNTSSIALIVGGSSGMGKATAERLLKQWCASDDFVS